MVNRDDPPIENILQPQTTQLALLIEDYTNQRNTDDNVEAEFPIQDDDSSKDEDQSSVAREPPTKKTIGSGNGTQKKEKAASFIH